MFVFVILYFPELRLVHIWQLISFIIENEKALFGICGAPLNCTLLPYYTWREYNAMYEEREDREHTCFLIVWYINTSQCYVFPFDIMPIQES